MAIRSAFYAASLVSLLTGSAAAAEPTVAPEYAGAEAGLIGIECAPEGESVGYRFRGVVVAAASADSPHEVILTTAHGFPASVARVTEECTAYGKKARHYPIKAIWRPRYRARGAIDDWAVVVTGRRFRESISRQPVRAQHASTVERAKAAQLPVRLPLRFLGAERDCTLRLADAGGIALETGLFSHTCSSWGGHSGSPVLLADTDGAFILGIHVGRRFVPEARASIRIGRFVDSEVLDAIGKAAAWREDDSR